MNIFTFYRTPNLYFGPGSFEKIPLLLEMNEWRRITVFTGASSFRNSEYWNTFRAVCEERAITLTDFSVKGEPSPEMIDSAVSELSEDPPQAIVSIGGGSVIDTGKAVSAMIKHEGPTVDYLEGVGAKKPTGEKLPFFAVPTTSGTGSEATKNAVISRVGKDGFKKSLRHDAYIPDYAIIDPRLILSCPPHITAASGLDAITQLVEGYVSSEASPPTDSIAIGGLMAAGRSFERAVQEPQDIQARTDMAYAAFSSGVVLANAGLGVIHGIAGALGGYSEIPHGVACGTLLAEATRLIVSRLEQAEDDSASLSLSKYADIGKYLRSRDEGTTEENCNFLVEQFEKWINDFKIPGLSDFEIGMEDLSEIVEKSGTKNTPVGLSQDDIFSILSKRLR